MPHKVSHTPAAIYKYVLHMWITHLAAPCAAEPLQGSPARQRWPCAAAESPSQAHAGGLCGEGSGRCLGLPPGGGREHGPAAALGQWGLGQSWCHPAQSSLQGLWLLGHAFVALQRIWSRRGFALPNLAVHSHARFDEPGKGYASITGSRPGLCMLGHADVLASHQAAARVLRCRMAMSASLARGAEVLFLATTTTLAESLHAQQAATGAVPCSPWPTAWALVL